MLWENAGVEDEVEDEEEGAEDDDDESDSEAEDEEGHKLRLLIEKKRNCTFMDAANDNDAQKVLSILQKVNVTS